MDIKRIATFAAAMVAAASLCGCSGVNTSSSAASGTGTAESSTAAGAPESTASPSAEPTAEESGTAAQRTAHDLADAVTGCLEWVAMEEVTDSEIANTLFGIDTSLLDDYYLATALMSVHLNEIIIVKPQADKEDEVKAQLDAHFEYIKDGAAFYPEQEKSAAGAAQGQTSDGYYYIIVHQIGDEIADVMEAYQPGGEIPQLEDPTDNITYESVSSWEEASTNESGTTILVQ